MENTINITPIVEAGILLIAAIISVFVIPWIKSKAKNEDTTNFLRWVEIAVAAAEQLYESTDGAAKKHYVLTYLRDKGIAMDAEDIENAIEAAVIKLHSELRANKEGDENAESK